MKSRTASSLIALALSGAIATCVGVVSASPNPEKTPKPCNPIKEIGLGPTSGNEYRFAVVGDTGVGCDPKDAKPHPQCVLSKKMVEVQARTKFSSLFLLGDNIYSFGNPNGIKAKIFEPYNELSKNGVLIKGVLGNHDVFNYKGADLQMKIFTTTDAPDQRHFFNTPVKDQLKFQGTAERYYAFAPKDNLIEFFALDSSMLTRHCCGFLFWKRKFTKGETNAHVEWLRSKLRTSTAKWKIVLLHHPFYSSALGHGVKTGKDQKETIPKQMRRLRIDQEEWVNIETVLVEAGVKLVLAGHDHVYERILPQKGIAHFVSGAGARLRVEDFKTERLPDFHGCGESKKLSFMLFSVKPDSVEFWSIDQDGHAFDHGTID
jgi:hypothetical protein